MESMVQFSVKGEGLGVRGLGLCDMHLRTWLSLTTMSWESMAAPKVEFSKLPLFPTTANNKTYIGSHVYWLYLKNTVTWTIDYIRIN